MYAIQRYKVTPDLVILNGTSTIDSPPITLNGKLKGVLINVPDLTGAGTLTLTIKDADGYTVFSKAAIPENAKFSQFIDANNQPLNLPLSGAHVITLTASAGNQASDMTIPVVLLIDRGNN